MPKTVLQELSEADDMHALAVKMGKQGDKVSAAALNEKVSKKRKAAIKRMGHKVKNANRGTKSPVI